MNFVKRILKWMWSKESKINILEKNQSERWEFDKMASNLLAWIGGWIDSNKSEKDNF